MVTAFIERHPSLCCPQAIRDNLRDMLRDAHLSTARACAEECDGMIEVEWYGTKPAPDIVETYDAACEDCASAIRARFGIATASAAPSIERKP